MRRLEAMFVNIRRIHFVGIGGIGMSGIAEVLLTLGFEVSGSDLKHSAITERLVELGATVREGHSAGNVAGAEVVVTSSAISPDNPEVAEAKRLHIPVIQRAEMLAELMRLKYGIAVAGMHGKTTTTSMIASVLFAGGLDPTVVVGGRVDALGSNARFGKSHYLVAEADESDRSFLKLAPIVAVITNLDKEHMDCYRDMADIEQTFVEFADRVPFYGMVVLCNDDERLRALLPRIARRTITYGLRSDSDFRILDAESELDPNSPQPMSRFSVSYRGKSLGDFHLHVPGRHNVLNAAAAVAVGVGLEIDTILIRLALENFRGVDRRFQVRGKAAGVTVVDDYGHHPTEIRATLAAARQLGFRKVHVVFQPHRFTRTHALLDEFGRAFADADSVFLLDIYPASEKPIPGVTARSVVEKIAASGKNHAVYASSFADAIEACTRAAADGDMILTLGAGNVSQLGPQILEKLAAREGISATAG